MEPVVVFAPLPSRVLARLANVHKRTKVDATRLDPRRRAEDSFCPDASEIRGQAEQETPFVAGAKCRAWGDVPAIDIEQVGHLSPQHDWCLARLEAIAGTHVEGRSGLGHQLPAPQLLIFSRACDPSAQAVNSEVHRKRIEEGQTVVEIGADDPAGGSARLGSDDAKIHRLSGDLGFHEYRAGDDGESFDGLSGKRQFQAAMPDGSELPVHKVRIDVEIGFADVEDAGDDVESGQDRITYAGIALAG